jgi:hypothetical protein
VARYFFDVQDGKPLVRDNDGAEFDTLDSAVQAAARSPAGLHGNRIAADRAPRPIPSGAAFL